jgi:hypothetical protein
MSDAPDQISDDEASVRKNCVAITRSTSLSSVRLGQLSKHHTHSIMNRPDIFITRPGTFAACNVFVMRVLTVSIS